jgi:hypothetical protein
MYVQRKQTYQQIAEHCGKSKKWVQKQIDEYFPPMVHIEPQSTPLLIDAFYFGKEKGFIVFRSPTLRKNLGWYEIRKETVDDYELGVMELISAGWSITGVTVDGKPGVIKRLEKMGFPVQMCQFHQIAIVIRYTTKNPRLPSARELKELVHLIPKTDLESFTYWLNEWHNKWKDFLNEKSYDPIKDQWRFTHDRLRKAYNSLKRHLPNLFIYPYVKNLPNTTNSLDGHFAHVRDKLNLHRGLKWHRKMKVVYELLG